VSGKVLVVYYTRKGATEKIAKEISGRLGADIEGIVDKKNRKGIIGWLRAGRDARARNLTEIEKPQREPSIYDLVVIGTPVWNGTISTPIRTYITQYRERFQDVAVFCTHSLAKDNTVLGEMEALVGKKPLASLKLRRKEQVETGEYIPKVEEFIGQLRSKHG